MKLSDSRIFLLKDFIWRWKFLSIMHVVICQEYSTIQSNYNLLQQTRTIIELACAMFKTKEDQH